MVYPLALALASLYSALTRAVALFLAPRRKFPSSRPTAVTRPHINTLSHPDRLLRLHAQIRGTTWHGTLNIPKKEISTVNGQFRVPCMCGRFGLLGFGSPRALKGSMPSSAAALDIEHAAHTHRTTVRIRRNEILHKGPNVRGTKSSILGNEISTGALLVVRTTGF